MKAVMPRIEPVALRRWPARDVVAAVTSSREYLRERITKLLEEDAFIASLPGTWPIIRERLRRLAIA